MGTWWPVAAISGVCLLTGCLGLRRTQSTPTGNASAKPMTIAVAPALNQSGSRDFDANRFSDLMASELTYSAGVSVVPVSRVLAVLAQNGDKSVRNAEHALAIGKTLGVDAVLVYSVTEYDPYDPPSIGLTCQLYGSRPGASQRSADPVALSRRAMLTASEDRTAARGLVSQMQRVFDASHDSVVRDVKRFARKREGDATPYGWRKHVVSQQHFIRFCCFSSIRELLSWRDETAPAEGDPRGAKMP